MAELPIKEACGYCGQTRTWSARNVFGELRATEPKGDAGTTKIDEEVGELRRELEELKHKVEVLEERLGQDSEGWRR